MIVFFVLVIVALRFWSIGEYDRALLSKHSSIRVQSSANQQSSVNRQGCDPLVEEDEERQIDFNQHRSVLDILKVPYERKVVGEAKWAMMIGNLEWLC